MALNLTNLVYSEKDIGASLKISKRQFIWEFDLNGSSQRIELLDSRLSGKKRLYKNGVNLLNTTEKGNFIHNFQIDGHPCVIIQYGDKIELRIDNQSFTHLYNLQKNKQLFAGEKGPTSNTYIAKPFNSYGNSESQNEQKAGEAIYKTKPEDENKPKLFNFSIKNNASNKPHAFNSKFKFGNKNESSASTFNQNNNNNINNNNNTTNNNNKGNIDLLGFQEPSSNTNNSDNASNNNNSLNFNANNSSNANNQNNQNQPKSGNDIFDLFGNNNNQNNNNNNQNNSQNNNPFNNIFLALSDGTNQQNTFDQNNLGFMGINNNMNNNNNMNMNNNNNMNMNNMNMNNNFSNQQMNQGMNQNNNPPQNQQNNGTIDLLNF